MQNDRYDAQGRVKGPPYARDIEPFIPDNYVISKHGDDTLTVWTQELPSAWQLEVNGEKSEVVWEEQEYTRLLLFKGYVLSPPYMSPEFKPLIPFKPDYAHLPEEEQEHHADLPQGERTSIQPEQGGTGETAERVYPEYSPIRKGGRRLILGREDGDDESA